MNNWGVFRGAIVGVAIGLVLRYGTSLEGGEYWAVFIGSLLLWLATLDAIEDAVRR